MLIDPDELEDLVVGELGGSALFGARFRENASRSLLIPRAYPGKRTPLWQQRLKAQSLLEVAKRYGDFPVILETYRECLRDVLDLPGLQDLLRALHARELSLVEVETPTASPFASSLLFDYVATYMYEGDTPNAERRAAALSLDRDLLRELLGQEELRDLIDPDALQQVEDDLQHRSRAHARRDARRAARRAAPRRRPDASDEVGDARARRASTPRRCCSTSPPSGARCGCASPARSAGSPPTTPACTATRSAPCRRAGCPRRSSPTSRTRSSSCCARYARTHGPFTTDEVRARYGVDVDAPRCGALERDGELVRGELRPGGTEREWCDPEVLRRLRRASLAVLRKEVEAVDQRRSPRSCRRGRASTATRRPAPASTGCARCSSRCRGSRCPPTCGSATCCRGAPARTRRRGWTSSAPPARSSGSAPGALGRNSGRVALYFREDAPLLGPPGAKGVERPAEREHDLLRERLGAVARASSPTCSPSSTWRPSSCRRRCGISSGPAR